MIEHKIKKCGCKYIEGMPIHEQCDEHLLSGLIEWHKYSNEEIFCPFCGVSSGFVKTNGRGFYRCKGKCKHSFFLMINIDGEK